MSNDDNEPIEPKLPLTVDSPIFWAEILIDNVELRKFYDARKVKCWDCCAAEVETFAMGAKVHEGGPYGALEPQKLVDELNDLAKNHPFKEETRVDLTLTRRIVEFFFSGK